MNATPVAAVHSKTLANKERLGLFTRAIWNTWHKGAEATRDCGLLKNVNDNLNDIIEYNLTKCQLRTDTSSEGNNNISDRNGSVCIKLLFLISAVS